MKTLRKRIKTVSTWGRNNSEVDGLEEENSYLDHVSPHSSDTINNNTIKFAFLQQHLNLRNERDIKEVYSFVKVLGSGTFGEVKLGKSIAIKTNTMLRAIKMVRKQNSSRKAEKLLENELNLLQKLSHPNVLHLVEFFETKSKLYIVSDACLGGELFDEILRKGELSEYDSCIVITQLLKVLVYLNECNVVHRDIKPENILLEKNRDLSAIKLIDFGNAIEHDCDKDGLLREKVGTPFYMSKELLERGYDHRTDVWSVGVILYIMLSGSPPFCGQDNAEIFDNIKGGQFYFIGDSWKDSSEESKSLVSEMLHLDFRKRKNAQDLLQDHAFFHKKGGLKRKKSIFRRMSESFGTLNSRLRRENADGDVKQALKSKMNKKNIKAQTKALKNLKRFRQKNLLHMVVRRFIITQYLPKKDREEMATLFKSWDTNNDGKLSKAEVQHALQSTAPDLLKALDVDALFDQMDLNSNGSVEYQEFLLVASDPKLMTKLNVSAVFDFLDQKQDGYLGIDSLSDRLRLNKGKRREVIGEILNEVDTEGTGRISKEQFLKLLVF